MGLIFLASAVLGLSLVGSQSALAASLLGGVGVVALLARRAPLRGTTLVAAWSWAVLSLVVLSTAEVLIGLSADPDAPHWARPLRYVAAMSTFCPLMAVLGAKRPQDRAWQFIVLSLWVILALPAFEWWLFGDAEGEIHAARSWFLAILIGVGVINYLPTRFWPSALLFAAMQVVLLASYLPLGLGNLPGAGEPLVAFVLAVAAIVLVCVGVPARRQVAEPLDRVWLDFRNAFGAVWGLRIAERINTSSRMYGWKLGLGWGGFWTVDSSASGIQTGALPAVRDSMRTLLRRFVSPAWIEERLQEPVPR